MLVVFVFVILFLKLLLLFKLVGFTISLGLAFECWFRGSVVIVCVVIGGLLWV